MSSFNDKPKGDDYDSDDEVAVVQTEETEAAPAVEEDTTLSNSDVCTKHQEAAKIVNGCIQHISSLVSFLFVLTMFLYFTMMFPPSSVLLAQS